MFIDIDKCDENPGDAASVSGPGRRFSQLDDDRLLTTPEVAEWLGVRPNTLAKARSVGLGSFPNYTKIGRSVRYRVEDVRRWLLECHRQHGGAV